MSNRESVPVNMKPKFGEDRDGGTDWLGHMKIVVMSPLLLKSPDIPIPSFYCDQGVDWNRTRHTRFIRGHILPHCFPGFFIRL